MNTELETFFKDTPLGIRSVLQGAVFLAEKVNNRKDLSGKEKTELIVKSMVEFLGEGRPELVALVEAVIPGVLEIVISTARGKYMLKQVTSCMPSAAMAMSSCIPSSTTGTSTKSVTTGDNTVVSSVVTQELVNEVSQKKASVWAWVRNSFGLASKETAPVNPASPTQTIPVTTIREPSAP